MTSLKINDNQSNAISVIRAISAIMIVLCHIFQGVDSELAWWFNVGVQIFLFMSGFLMAKDYIESAMIFLKKRCAKILIPYYVFLVLIILVYSLFGISVSLESIFTYIFCLQGITYANVIPGLEHLWFVSIIMLCYILTLLLNTLRSRISERQSIFLIMFLLVIIQIVVNISILPVAFGARIGAFVLGYFVACKSRYDMSKTFVVNVFIVTLTTLLIRLYYTYINTINSVEINDLFNSYFVNWQHTLLGIFIFIAIYYYISKSSEKKNIRFLNVISKYSYEIYLVHQVFILGPISILFITKNIALNVVIILSLIMISSKIVYEVVKCLKYFAVEKATN